MTDKVYHPHSNDDFKAKLSQSAGKLVVVDFSATWCGPCRMIAPKFSELSNANPDVVFVHVDIDELNTLPEVEAIAGVPHFKFFRDGKFITEFSGANVAKLTETIQIHSKN